MLSFRIVANFHRQILSGVYLSLDKSKLSNIANLDPGLMAKVAPSDPGNSHGVIYMWGTYGLGYSVNMMGKLLPGVPLDSWGLIFDPAYAKQLGACGISMIDDPSGVVRLVLLYLGKSPAAPSLNDLPEVETILTKIRPYVRNINSSFNMEAMAQGEACISIGYNGAFMQARQKSKETKTALQLTYVIPKQGSLLWVDMLAIPRDAPHQENAYRFINFLMNPPVIAKISNAILFANANTAAAQFLDPSIVADTVIYPTPDERQRLFLQTGDSPELARAITRLWQKFKTGQ